eukprot:CAMPEP_0118694226 /NCGR_PEP_ID=MMETSP0800-20121206/12380_1 /TAXON_ID=210618 ORGANISM="Striatella unipunctata, Strain CCMP2910" /NCGR_SAMPLE_ID=MMETSP0800 /ASSEMBLY_ACC=CAM_ASM_000638 /LENGTH=255 /DNA_ID=CAMNT_0006592617 /DNA_START=22 /DNA_END=789 /DNA_ORIENTATION=-
MSNIHGLHNSRKSDDDDEEEDNNNRYVGGVDARGGGSGLAVEPNPNNSNNPNAQQAIFGMAEASTGSEAPPRRTITMYREGFVVDDGPYRRLDDPNNAEFLRALASGHTPRELLEDRDHQDMTVGLIDKRNEDYVERFKSFSGEGNSLGGGKTEEVDDTTIVDPSNPPSPAPDVDASRPTTSLQIRLSNGKRVVIKMNLDDSLEYLVARLQATGQAGTQPYQLASGFPPQTLQIGPGTTIEQAGLKGAQVVQKAK